MTNDPVSEFEQCLHKATKWRHHNDAVKEIAGHYQDLYQEALLKGASVNEARTHADNKIGNVSEIAKGIRAGNGKSIGMKLQWIAMALLVFGAFLPRFAEVNGYEVGSLWGYFVQATDPFGLITIYLAGFLAAFGIFRAKRAVFPAFCIGLILIPLGHAGFILWTYKSFSFYEIKQKYHVDKWHEYAVKYRPILRERYDLYEVSLTGSQQESAEAIKKLSASIHRPQDRGMIISEPTTGKWIYPTAIQKLRDNGLNLVYFSTTNSFETAQKGWRSSDLLLKAMPTIRKGTEAELESTAARTYLHASERILSASLRNVLPFLTSFLLSLLMIGIVNNINKLTSKRRRAL